VAQSCLFGYRQDSANQTPCQQLIPELLPVHLTEPWGFCVGAQVDQTDQEIEHIARAFFVARHETAVWETASRVLKHEFRLYARHALSMLERKQEQGWGEGRNKASTESLEAA